MERDGHRIVRRPSKMARGESFQRFMALEGMAWGAYSLRQYLADKREDMELEDQAKLPDRA
jgi:hypothetical protein